MKNHAAPAVALAFAAALSAQTSWTLQTPANSPLPLTAHSMSYYLPAGSTILFGGTYSGLRRDETWSYDGIDWTQLTPATVPMARVAHSTCLDLGRGVLVMYGGLAPGGIVLDDVWEWNGSDWTNAAPSTPIGGRWAYCMCYHPVRGTSMLYGGYQGQNFGDFWEWDGATWTQIVTTNSPGPRRASAMEWDPVSGNVILFGGYPLSNDTWSFDGTDWTQLSPTTVPPARYDHAMATDLSRSRIVMFGGPNDNQTWEWDGFDWLDRTNPSAPSQRLDTYLAYDWVREEVTMFGSAPTSETWRYAPDSPATFTVLGQSSCLGTNGLSVTVSGSDRPWLDEVFEVTLSNLPSNGIGLMVLGLSDTVWALGPLPAPLDSIGMTGCLLQVDPLQFGVVLAAGTSAVWQFPIPYDTVLLGAEFFAQGGALDLPANPFGLTVGNYGRAVIGGK
ncbi:MAG: hypothetical protein H6835_10755 [Planctomycetes bacterium]|nr:hypothetical protein [Planctomycetota bacterium]